jgi:hypothetical protein
MPHKDAGGAPSCSSVQPHAWWRVGIHIALTAWAQDAISLQSSMFAWDMTVLRTRPSYSWALHSSTSSCTAGSGEATRPTMPCGSSSRMNLGTSFGTLAPCTETKARLTSRSPARDQRLRENAGILAYLSSWCFQLLDPGTVDLVPALEAQAPIH